MDACALLQTRFALPARLTADVVDYTDAVAALKPLVAEHLRLTAAQLTAQTATVEHYIKTALIAAERYTNRDIALHEKKAKFTTTFAFYGGAATLTSVKNSAAVALATTDYEITSGIVTGFNLTVTSPDGNEYEVSFKSGYEDPADFPAEVVQFVLAAAGAFFEIREMANYTSMVQFADFLPTYLLDPIKIYVIA